MSPFFAKTRMVNMRSVLALLFAPFLFAQKQPFDAETLLRISRISQPALSPNGRQVAFTVQTIDVQKNTKPQQIYVVPIDGGHLARSPRKALRMSVRAGRRIRARSISFPTAAGLHRSG